MEWYNMDEAENSKQVSYALRSKFVCERTDTEREQTLSFSKPKEVVQVVHWIISLQGLKYLDRNNATDSDINK